ncbi:hypothetical protein K0M31_000580 [Melipona bicolor]|uniref:Uncharacterized protein n=1 Tax=Melipona bicolor TaxID=60889 RepID=A0AA40KWV5_9HYME|nr:hypothetical protein K0M31_000580 [Melipona bicolor]
MNVQTTSHPPTDRVLLPTLFRTNFILGISTRICLFQQPPRQSQQSQPRKQLVVSSRLAIPAPITWTIQLFRAEPGQAQTDRRFFQSGARTVGGGNRSSSISRYGGTRIGVTQALICRSLSFFDLDTRSWPGLAFWARPTKRYGAIPSERALVRPAVDGTGAPAELRRAYRYGIDYERVDLIGFLSKLIRSAIPCPVV